MSTPNLDTVADWIVGAERVVALTLGTSLTVYPVAWLPLMRAGRAPAS